jgi:hypothetical protein
MTDRPGRAKVFITLSPTGRLCEVRVDAPVPLIEDLTEKAVNLARRLDTVSTPQPKKDADNDRLA